MNRSRLALSLSLVAAALSGCVQGPDYKHIETPAPSSFRFGPGSNEPSSIADLPWWEVFKDPALQSLIRESLNSNYDLRIAVSRIEQARAIQAATASSLYPQVGYNAGLSHGRNAFVGSPAPNGGDTTSSALLTLNAAWELDIWGRIQRADEAALAEILAAEEVHRAVMLSLVTEVAQTYIELIELDLELQIARSNVASFEKTYDLFNRRSTGGVSTRLQVLRAQADLSQVAATIPEIQRLIGIKENAICVLLGKQPGPIDRAGMNGSPGQPILEQQFPVSIPVGLPSTLVQRRPDILAAEARVAAASARVGVAMAERFPRIGLTAFFGKASPELNDFTSGVSNAWALGVTAAGPIFNGGLTQAQIDLAKAQLDQAVLEYQKAVNNSFSEVSDALVTRERLAEVESELTKQVGALTEAVDMSRQRYDVGKANYFEILDSQKQLYPAETARARAKADQFIAVIQLYKALGGGWNVSEKDWANAPTP